MLIFGLILVIGQGEAINLNVMRYLVRDKAFDARDFTSPAAHAPIVPILPVPQRPYSDPPTPPKVINPIPLVMYDGVSPYSNLPGSKSSNNIPPGQLSMILFHPNNDKPYR